MWEEIARPERKLAYLLIFRFSLPSTLKGKKTPFFLSKAEFLGVHDHNNEGQTWIVISYKYFHTIIFLQFCEEAETRAVWYAKQMKMVFPSLLSFRFF